VIDYDKILLEQLLANAPCALYWRDRQGRYLGCNKLFAQQLCLPIQDIIGKVDAQLPWGAKDHYQTDQEVIRSKTVIERIEQVVLAHRTMTLQITRVPLIYGGKVLGVLGISLDMTDFFQWREQAEAADKLKMAFIRDMEHDIRTPVAGIWGMSNILLTEETDPHKQDALKDINRCAKELLNYCTGIVDASKLQNQAPPILAKSFNLKALIESLIHLEIPSAKNKNLLLEMHYDPHLPEILKGDPFRIHRILLNLVSNAIKFTHHGQVTVNARRIEKQLSTRELILELSVNDTGIGIPENKTSWIYEKFAKVEASNTGYGQAQGQGFGLTIVKSFVEDLNGEIHLKTKLGEGSTFILHFPVKVPLTELVV
jgi:signal transduction histidine kinase